MQHTITDNLRALLTLQKVDDQLDAIVNLRGKLPEDLDNLRSTLADCQAHITTVQERITTFIQEIATKRLHIKAHEEVIEKYEQQQMNVRNNREYSTITKEIDLQKLEIQLIEKHIKSTYAQVEEEKLSLEKHQQLVAAHTQALADKEKALDGLIIESKGQEDTLKVQRANVLSNLDDSLLSLYTQLRTRVRRAVVTVQFGACGGCFSSIPPQVQMDINEGKRLIRCEHCGRILVPALDNADPS